MAQLITKKGAENRDLEWLRDYWGRGVERIFFIYGVPEGVARGRHHHARCQMGLICVSGSVSVYVQSPHRDYHFTLDTPEKVLLLDPEDWRMMYNFSDDAVLMVMADRSYQETSYYQEMYRELKLPVSSSVYA